MRMRNLPTPILDPTFSTRLLWTLGLLVATASIGAIGTWATFTTSTSQPQTVKSGTLSIALGATGAQTNRLDVEADDIAPGDTIERSVDLSNSASTVDLAAVTLTTTASPSSLLDTDATHGLQMTIDRCSQAWTEAGSAPAYTYTCGGTTQSVLASTPVIGSNMALNNLSSLTAGQTDHLLITLTLPTSADNTFQGLQSTISYEFVGTQRAGTSK